MMRILWNQAAWVIAAAATALCWAEAGDLEKPSDSRVLPVRDGKAAAFLLQFDDAHASQVPVVVPALRERGLVGTFYIFNRKELTDRKEGWMEAAKSGVVTFGNHSFTHEYTQNSFPDVETCDRQLSQCNELIHELTPTLPWPRLIPYARPGGKTPENKGIGEAGMQPVLEKNRLFVRPNFWGASLHVKTLDDMKRVVDQAVKNGGMGHLDFHGVGKASTINVTKDDFIAFLDHVVKNKDSLWITDCASWHGYETEKKDASVTVLRSIDSEIALSLTCSADKQFYSVPLTIETRVPSGWARCQATQDGKSETVDVREGVARYNAVPNGGEIVLRSAASL